ncbi:hypothetical protein JTB14_018119 [Gonioctena quinquepunctata]|nr:hypothetical protein JTB14_018119 [Gonioctena quinquepunctata]
MNGLTLKLHNIHTGLKYPLTMLRRPPTSIELKLDDINEYEEIRQQSKEKQQKPFPDPPSWQPGPKSKQEIYSRVGYVPMEHQPTRINSI